MTAKSYSGQYLICLAGDRYSFEFELKIVSLSSLPHAYFELRAFLNEDRNKRSNISNVNGVSSYLLNSVETFLDLDDEKDEDQIEKLEEDLHQEKCIHFLDIEQGIAFVNDLIESFDDQDVAYLEKACDQDRKEGEWE